MPGTAGNNDLWFLSSVKIRTYRYDLGRSVGMKLELGHRVAQIEMEYLVGRESMHGGALVRR